MKQIISLTISFLIIFTANTFAKPKEVPTAAALFINTVDNSPPMGFSRLVFNVPETQNLGRSGYSGFLMCAERFSFELASNTFNLENRIFVNSFTEVMKKANFNIPGDPNDLFKNNNAVKPEFMVAAMITDFEVDYCHAINGTKGSGQLYMKLDWQIYNISKGEVVYQKETEGYLKIKKKTDGVLYALLNGVFKNALYKLLETDEFANAISANDRKFDDPSFDSFNVNYIASETRNKSVSLNEARHSVVTIRAATGGHGSGFFISENGYILTNRHVVTTSKNVIVEFENGMELEGEVIRSAEKRDVALIKVPLSRSVPLALRLEEPDIGTEVYAIGSPVDTALSGTVSQGIISSFRMMDNLEYIQSDALINGGNSGGPMVDKDGYVVAISVLKRNNADGIAFFIPIKFALEALNIQLPNAEKSKYN